MPLIVQSNTTKRLYQTTNICILVFTVTWLVLSILQLFDNEIIESISGFLLLFSIPVFILGVVSVLAVAILDKTQEVSEEQVQQLLLNIDQKDYEKGDLSSIKANNNFIVVRNLNHEINSFEALKLFETAKDKGIEVKLTRQGSFRLDRNPKDLFNDCIGTLWAASV